MKYEDSNKSDDGDVIIQSEYEGDTSSLFSSQSIVKSDDESHMQQYKLRKVKKIVAKCCIRKIKFDKYFVNLSYQLAQDEDSLSMAELEKLRVECNEALGSDYCSTESSSSDSSAEKKKTQCKKKKLSYLISTTSTDSVSGCDGGIFTSPILAPQSYAIKPIYRPQPFCDIPNSVRDLGTNFSYISIICDRFIIPRKLCNNIWLTTCKFRFRTTFIKFNSIPSVNSIYVTKCHPR